jgi:anti-sigma-K factor RskA
MSQTEDRLIELLTERSERKLTAAESAELRGLLEANEGWHLNDLDYASAAAHLALDPPTEAMPDALKARIIGGAVQRAASMRSPAPAPRPAPTAVIAANDDDKRPPRTSLWIGWLAAAAAVALAVAGWRDELIAPPDAAELRAALIDKDASAIRVAWTQTKDPLGTRVTGDVVWSDARQEGYMRFSGLPRNNPAENQYQLWVFDKDRDERFPVDGGVFDIDADTGEVIVPIRAKIAVSQATLFAVTLEKPGGVVVSTRERLVTLAKPSA